MPRAQKPKGWTGSGVPPSYRLPDSYREQVLRDLNRDDTIDSKNPKTLKLFKLIEGAFISYYCWREGFDRKPTPASRLRELAFLRKQVHETHEALAQLPTAVRMDILRAIADRHPKNPDWHKKTGDTPKKIVHLWENMQKKLRTLQKLITQAEHNLERDRKLGAPEKHALPSLYVHLEVIFRTYYQKGPLIKEDHMQKFYKTLVEALGESGLTNEHFSSNWETIKPYVKMSRRLNKKIPPAYLS